MLFDQVSERKRCILKQTQGVH